MRHEPSPSLSPRELANAGYALFGANWRAELAQAFGLEDEGRIHDVEAGRETAPPDWRARLIALAQDAALKAMDVASTLIWSETRAAEAENGVKAASAAATARQAPRLV